MASLVLILVVLLQSGKAGDLASAFGGAGSQTAFGARGAATLLTKATTVSAVVFMATSLSLAVLFTQGEETTVLETVPAAQTAPAVPAAEPTAPPAEPPAVPAESSQPLEGEAAPPPAPEQSSEEPQ